MMNILNLLKGSLTLFGFIVILISSCGKQKTREEELAYYTYSPEVNKVDSTSNPDYIISIGLRSTRYFGLKDGDQKLSSDEDDHTRYFLVTILKKISNNPDSKGLYTNIHQLKAVLDESFELSLNQDNQQVTIKSLSVENIKANTDLTHLSFLLVFDRQAKQNDLHLKMSDILLGSASDISFE